MLTVICCTVVTLIVIVLEFAVDPVTQEALLVNWQLTCWPSVSALVVQVAEVAPWTGLPFSSH
jgi:hypothetical protein